MLTFLRAQLDDDEALARQAFADHNAAGAEWTEIWSGAVQLGEHEDLLLTNDSGVSRHIIRHDPGQVLAEVEAKRRIIAQYEAMKADMEVVTGTISEATAVARFAAYDTMLRVMTLPYQDRPGYDPAWGKA